MGKKIFVIDDDPNILDYMEEHLSLNGFEVEAFLNPSDAVISINEAAPDLVITDVKMDEMTGDDVLNHVIKNHPGMGVILITGFGNISHSVNAIRKGAFDYITKPFSGKEFISRIEQYFKHLEKRSKAPADHQSLPARQGEAVPEEQQGDEPDREARPKYRLVGEDPKIQKLKDLLPQIAPTSASVMIQGESGTGKEVYAGLIHQNSNRADEPYIKINCANLPRELVESTLFGHVKGAFTGAVADKTGAFHEANGGTLLLDEITEIELNIQAKLLRVLQENEFQRIGSQKSQKVDVRIISTTNRNIEQAISDGQFRKDLYFRLNVFPIRMIPLRERIKDIPLLGEFFCEKYSREYGLDYTKTLSNNLEKHLLKKDWPGNVRELENYIQRGVIMSQDQKKITVEHVEDPLFQNVDGDLAREVMNDIPVLPIEEMELQMIKKALERTNGNQKEAAELLQISDRTIRNKLKKIEFPDEEE